MAKNMGRIGFGVDFNVNKASLDQVKKSLQELKNMSKDQIEAAGGSILPMSDGAIKSWKNDLGAMRKELDALDKAMEDAFNPKLGTYQLDKFNASLKESGTSAERVFQTVNAYGNAGSGALLNMTTQMLATDRAAKQVHSTFQKLGDTMMNTIRWSITSSAINMVTGAIQSAYHYAVDLDKSLNDIMIVTDKSAEDMEDFARSANKAAKSLGASTKDYTSASLIYYQQGLNDNDVKARTETTLKAAAITGQSANVVSEQLTAVWNGYKVNAEEAELYIDKLSAVAATTAADLEELSTGMSKVASAANVMGVDVDQLNAQLATIVSVTRQAPESVGTALKTVYARMSDIEAGLDTETTLGEYTEQMAQMGINVLDAKGNLRDMGDVVEEIGNKWNGLNREQQVSLAQSIAGTRQYNNMMALFDNWDMYQDALTTSLNSAGALSAQHAEYLDSITAHQNKLRASAEGLYDSIFDSDEIKGVYSGLTDIVTLVDELVQAMGGMPGILAAVGMLFAKAAKNSIADLVSKQQANKLNNEIYRNQIKNGKEFIEQQMSQIKVSGELEQHFEKIKNLEADIYKNADNLTDDQWNTLQEGVRKYNEQVQKTIELERERQEVQSSYNAMFSNGKSIAYETYTVNGEQKTRRKKAKELIEGSRDYYLWSEEEDQIDKKTGKRKAKGLTTARKERSDLEALKITGKLNTEQEKRLKLLQKYIPQAEEENKILKRKIQLETENAAAIKKSKDATEDIGNELDNFLKKSTQGNTLANLTEEFTSFTFSIVGASSSAAELFRLIEGNDATLTDYMGTIGGLAMSFAPLISRVWNSITAFKAAKQAAIASGEGAKAGAKGWAAFQAAMGPVGWIMLAVTAITSILSGVSAAQEKAREITRETDQKKLEEAKAKREEAEANAKLTQSYLNAYSTYVRTGEEKEKLIDLASQVAKAYESEELQNLALAGSYEQLTAKVKEYRAEASKRVVEQAEEGKKQAEVLINTFSLANDLEGMSEELRFYNGEAQWVTLFDTGNQTANYLFKDEGKNAEILAQISTLIGATSAGEAFIKSNLTAEEKIQLKEDLQKAVQHKDWTFEESEINDAVQELLANEALSAAIEAYQEENKKINIEKELVQRILESDFSKDTKLKDFADKRESLIKNYMNTDTSLDRDTAAYQVDTELAKQDADVNQLLSRTKWLAGNKSQFSDSVMKELMDQMSVSSFGESEFGALQLIDIDQYKNDADGLIKAARDKAKQLRYSLQQDNKDAILQSSETRINDLEKEIEKSVGEDKIAAIKKQNEELNTQIALLEQIRDTSAKTNKENAQQEFLDLAQKYKFENQLKLGDDWDVVAVMESIEKSGLGADEKQNLERKLFEDVLTSQNEYNEIQDEIDEIEDNKTSNQIRLLEVRIEAKFDKNEAQKEYLEFIRSTTDETAYTELTTLALNDFKASLDAIEDYKFALSELDKSDLDPAEKKTKQQEYINQLLAEGANLLDIRNTLEETYLSYQDAVNESYEEYLSLIETANNLLEHQVTVNELLYGDKAFKYMGDYYKKQVANSELIANANKERYEQDKADYDNLIKEGLAFDDEKVIAAREQYLASGEAYAEALAAEASAYAEQYSNTLETILSEFSEKMLSEDAIKEWQWVTKTEEMFIDSIEEAYGKASLQRSLNKAMRETSNLNAQKSLKKIYDEQLKILQEKDKLTQRDLERAQQQLNIEIARLALEDARDSKTKMRLMRGADGVYGYQYVADQQAIDEKEKQYEDALKKQRDDDQAELKEQISTWQQLQSDMSEDLSELNIEDSDYDVRKQAILEKYSSLFKAIRENIQYSAASLEGSNAELSKYYGTDIVDPLLISKAVQGVLDIDSDNIDTWLSETGESITSAQEDAKKGIDSAVERLANATEDLYSTIMGGDSSSGLLGAQKDQITNLNNMNAAIVDVVTTLGLLDTAIAVAKGDIANIAEGADASAVAAKYNIAVKNDQITMTPKAYDTGGYTGVWGSDGRIAMLHEKELVLNKQDTVNVLKAVDIVRSLGDSMLKTISGMGSGYDLPMAAWELAKEFIVEQTVSINAEFPNATDRSEIEAAFDELILLATQHAYEDVRGR